MEEQNRTNRLGKLKLDNNVPQLIIVKFAKYNVRVRIFKTKKNLKGKQIEHYGKSYKDESN